MHLETTRNKPFLLGKLHTNYQMKNHAIIFDIDGTAVDSPSQKLPSEMLIQATHDLRTEYFLCAATGRVWTFAKPVLHSLQLTDPCIISAGTQICNPVTGEILWQKTIDGGALKEILSIFQQFPDYKLLYNDGNEDDYFNGGSYPKDFTTHEPVYFLEQVFIPDELALVAYDKLNSVEGVTCVMVVSQKPGCRDLHIINSSATKEHAIAELIAMLRIDKTNTIGIGDGHNDIHLFNAVHTKIAMGNAVPELKEMADKIIGSVQEDGLAGYFKTL